MRITIKAKRDGTNTKPGLKRIGLHEFVSTHRDIVTKEVTLDSDAYAYVTDVDIKLMLDHIGLMSAEVTEFHFVRDARIPQWKKDRAGVL